MGQLRSSLRPREEDKCLIFLTNLNYRASHNPISNGMINYENLYALLPKQKIGFLSVVLLG